MAIEESDPFGSVEVKREKERGDIAKSLQQLIHSQFMSKRFYDVYSASRLTKRDVFLLAMLGVRRGVDKILSLSEIDTKAKGLTSEEREEIKELYELKKRMARNPTALSYAITDVFMYLYTLGLQSLDGMSRMEGMSIASGNIQRVMMPNEMNGMQRLRNRLTGKVFYHNDY